MMSGLGIIFFAGIGIAWWVGRTSGEMGWIIAAVVTVVISLAAGGIGDGDCYVDYDGRSNPTICE